MSQHDFNIANQSFPATRTDLNNALVALASNSSGDAEPATKYANQWWYETDTNTLKLRNEANDAWISIAVLDQSGNAVQSITTAGLTLGSTAISATGTEINQLDAITRGSILYGNASGATARLAAGGASTVLTSDGTDISWGAAGGGNTDTVVFPNLASPDNTYTSSATWSKGSLSDDDYVWMYLCGGGGGGMESTYNATGGDGGGVLLLYGKAKYFDGGAYVIGAGGAAGAAVGTSNTVSTFTLTSTYGSVVYTTLTGSFNNSYVDGENYNQMMIIVDPATFTTQSTTLIQARNSTPRFIIGDEPTGWSGAQGTAYRWMNADGNKDAGYNGIFGGGAGGGRNATANYTGYGASLYAGRGGSSGATAEAGTVPGGGGGASTSGGSSGAGAAGNMRVYHV